MNMRISLLLGAVGVIGLGACTNPDGTMPGSNMSKTQQGALIGALAGGALAAGRDDDKNNQGKDFLKGAVLGAAAGAVVGNVMEAQEIIGRLTEEWVNALAEVEAFHEAANG